ncbi:hypothetical protein KSP40_PGU006473 [Platanthera guangdongensis]|uniref:Uncharacterized protein n=1 Tax=Platanthera guangdongensis TaxID=2320717 RepID=A0ABR2LUC3_9ASPA
MLQWIAEGEEDWIVVEQPMASDQRWDAAFSGMQWVGRRSKRGQQEQERREREELDKLLEQNRLRVEEARRREAVEQQEKELERYQELELLQRQKEEAMRRKKLEEEAERANQMKLLGKNRARPKLSFAIGLK